MSTSRKTPANAFKDALSSRTTQIGIWLAMGCPTSAEICANAGFDWAVIDAEHGPYDVSLLLSQLRAIAGSSGCQEVVRVPSSDAVVLRQIVDAGARNILVPMVSSPEQAESVVAACRFPPHGERGVGSCRASRWGGYSDYLQVADERLCLLVQVETKEAMTKLREICAVDGVDGVFIGPADLAASMGHIGNPMHDDVTSAIRAAVRTISDAGKPAGTLILDEAFAHELIDLGAVFVAVNVDTRLLMTASRALAQKFKP